MPKLLHYTVNTAHTFDCSNKQYKEQVLQLLLPIAQRAISEGRIENILPRPFEQYSIRATVVNSCALFDIYEQNIILNTNAVAWSDTD